MEHVFAGVCETGAKREMNQDTIIMKSDKKAGLFAVADGMGGHSRGEFASQTIISCLNTWWNGFNPNEFEGDFGRMILSLNRTLEKANNDIFENTKNGEICGSTVVVMFIYDEYYGMLTAGDSRIYYYNKKHLKPLKQISVDETWENQTSNKLSDKEKKASSNYGKLVNAVGISEKVRITTKTNTLDKGFLYALCSDGIYKYGSEKVFSKELKKASSIGLENAIEHIRNDVYEQGANDNMSLILIGDAAIYKIR